MIRLYQSDAPVNLSATFHWVCQRSTHIPPSPDVVLVSILGLLNNELGVKQDEAAHDEQPEVQVRLWKETTSSWKTRTSPWKHLVCGGGGVCFSTLNSITDPKNMFITDIRNRMERPDISVPERGKGRYVRVPERPQDPFSRGP